MKMKRQNNSIWSIPFLTLLVVNLFNSAGQYMIGSALTKYSNYLGASPVVIGLVSSAFSIAALVVRPVTGSALDYFRKKTMLCISLAITAAMYTICAFTDNVTVLICTRFIDGVGASVKIPLCLALTAEFLPEDKVGSGIGIYSVAQTIASALGPGICLSLIENCGYRATLLFIALTAILALAFAISLSPAAYVRPDRKFRVSLDSIFVKEAILPALIILPLAMPYACTMSYLPIMGELYCIPNIGLYYTVYSIFLFIIRPICGKLLDKAFFTWILIPSLICYGLSMVIISKSVTLTGFLIASVFAALGYGVAHPCLQSLCMKWVPKEKRGASGNTYYIGVDIGNFAGTLFTGQLISSLMVTRPAYKAYSSAFLILVVPISVSLLVTVYAGFKRRREENGQQKAAVS